MNFSRMVPILVFSLLLASCQNTINKKASEDEKKKQVPSTETRKTEKSIPRLNRRKPAVRPQDKDSEKKKPKVIDTLKPVVAIP